VPVQYESHKIKVATPEDLVLYKLKARRPLTSVT